MMAAVTPPEDPRAADRPDVVRRRQLLRRRVGAAVALVVVVWVLFGLSSMGGGGGVSGPNNAAATGIAEAISGSSPIAVQAAEDTRERRGIDHVLSYTSFVAAGGYAKREIALTFDDGPGPFTPQVLATLERLHVPATMFIVGRVLKDFGTEFPQELADGLAIGDHTQDHLPMATLSRRDQVSEILTQATAIRSYGAAFPRLFRPPYGSLSRTTLAVTKKLRMLIVLWTIDTSDYRQPGVSAIVDSVLSGARPGAIVLMHDAGGQRSETIAALPIIVHALRRRGYDLVTVPRLMADDPPPPSTQGPPMGLAGGG